MRGLNLSTFKKMKEDKDSAMMIHKDGHTLIIAKGPLPAAQRKALEALPIHKGQHFDEGGTVQGETLGSKIGYPGADKTAPKNPKAYKDGGTVVNDIHGNPEATAENPLGTDVRSEVPADPIPGPTADINALPANPAAAAPVVSSGSPDQPQPMPQGGVPFQTPQQAQLPGFEAEKAANLAQAQALQQQGKEESNAINLVQDQISKLPTQADIIARHQKQSEDLFNAYKDKTIDPDHYWQDHSQIAAGIGLLFSGLGSAVGGGPNLALNLLQKGIDRDIEAQKNAQDQKHTLWRMNREALGSDLEANLATQNQLYTGLKFKIEQAAANAKGPIALANAHAANARVDQAIQLNNFKLSLMNPSSDNPDPASRVQFLVPPERQQKVFDEIDAAKNTVQNSKGIDEAFWQAAKDARPFTGGVNTSPKAFIPGVKTAGQAALIARLGPTFSDIEHTVRQAAMDNMEHNVVPRLGDSDKDIQTKWKSLQDYKTSKASAATAKGFGIDLSRFPSTNVNGLRSASSPQMETQLTKGGVPYRQQVINGKIYMVPIAGK